MTRIRVLLADDNEAILKRVRSVLGSDFDIVCSVHDGQEAIVEVARLDPDVLVIDISMPVLNGIEAGSRLHSAKRRTKVVFLTVHQDQDFVDAAFAVGAFGYVIKSELTTDLVPAIHQIVEGRTFISRSIAR